MPLKVITLSLLTHPVEALEFLPQSLFDNGKQIQDHNIIDDNIAQTQRPFHLPRADLRFETCSMKTSRRMFLIFLDNNLPTGQTRFNMMAVFHFLSCSLVSFFSVAFSFVLNLGDTAGFLRFLHCWSQPESEPTQFSECYVAVFRMLQRALHAVLLEYSNIRDNPVFSGISCLMISSHNDTANNRIHQKTNRSTQTPFNIETLFCNRIEKRKPLLGFQMTIPNGSWQ